MATPYVPYDGPIVTSDEARAAGLKRYFTGEPCLRGHVFQRMVSNNRCVVCYYLLRKPPNDRERETTRIWCAQKRAANPEERRTYKRAYYQRNKAKIKAQTDATRKKHPDTGRCGVRNYRARKRQADGRHTAADVAAILKAQKGKCAYCRKKVGDKFDVDHIRALSDGGTNDRSNLQITCPPCNRSKHNLDALVFARKIGLLL